jgi:hypothetical protein
MEIIYKYVLSGKVFKSKSRPNWRPIVNVVIKDIEGNQTLDENFLVDSGASITILNRRADEFIKRLTPVDYFEVQYGGGGIQKLPVYNLFFILKGIEIPVLAAYDQNLVSSEHLWGITAGLDFFDLIVFNNQSQTKHIKLVKK